MTPEAYRNFLNWLCATFNTTEAVFRKELVALLRLRAGQKVLVTACGLGDDIPALRQAADVTIEAQDVDPKMLEVARRQFPGIRFSEGDAGKLDFPDASFDAAFHFGGLNQFSQKKEAIHEMARVVKDGGRIVVSDEGVAPWLRETEYGKMVVKNIDLWASVAPIEMLPPSAVDVSLTWILGNCFYVVAFTVDRKGPYINPDIPHAGWRGGTMRTRYHGQLEGVSPEAKAKAIEAAKRAGLSVSEWLQRAIERAL